MFGKIGKKISLVWLTAFVVLLDVFILVFIYLPTKGNENNISRLNLTGNQADVKSIVSGEQAASAEASASRGGMVLGEESSQVENQSAQTGDSTSKTATYYIAKKITAGEILSALDHDLTYKQIAQRGVRRWNMNIGSVNSKKIVDYSIQSRDLDTNSVYSRAIEDHSIQSRDLQDNIRIRGYFTVEQNAFFHGGVEITGDVSAATGTVVSLDGTTLTYDTANLTTANISAIDLGTNTITDGNLTGNWNFNAGNLSGLGNLLPALDDTYDLGSNTLRWRNIYLGGETIHLGTSTSDEYAIEYNTLLNYLGFNVNGSGNPEIVFDSSGNVGIGTTAPGGKLQIVGGDTLLGTGTFNNPSASEDLYVTGNLEIDGTLYYAAIGYGGSIIPTLNDTFDLGSDAFRWKDLWLGGETLHIGTADADEGEISYITSNNVLQFQSNGNLALQPASGNVGIGTTGPGNKLTVSGGVGIGTTAPGSLFLSTVAPDGGLIVEGKVGIGKNNPYFTFSVAAPDNGSNVGMAVYSAGSGINFKNNADTAEYGVIHSFSNGSTGLLMTTGGSSGVVALQNNGGNVGIGTTAPGGKLQIVGGDTLLGTGTFNNPSASEDLYVTGNLEIDGTLYYAAIGYGGSIIPTLNDTFDLGSDAFRWKDLWLGGETLHIGTADADEGEISYITSNNVLQFQSNGNLALQPASGNVGIGTTGPGNKLTVSGGVGIGTTAPGSLFLSTVAPDGGLIVEGKVGIGTTNPTSKLTVQGTATISTSVETAMITGISSSEKLTVSQAALGSALDVGNQVLIHNSLNSKQHSYKGELHTHTTNSDGVDTPTAAMNFYKNDGYSFVFITDHDYLTPDPGVSDILYIGGVEETAVEGHINAWNVSSQSATTSSQELINAIRGAGGEACLNHPGWPGNPWTNEEIESLRGFKFLEIYNPLDANPDATDKWDAYLSKGFKVWGTAAEDSHNYATYRNLAWVVVNADTLTVTSIIKALTDGNFYATAGPSLAVSVSGNTITVSTGALSSISWIKKNGTVIKTTTDVLSDSYDVAGDEMYVRVAVIRNSDGKKAWSQPVFIDLLDISNKYASIISTEFPIRIPYPLAIGNSAITTNQPSLSVTTAGNGPVATFLNGNVGIGTTAPDLVLDVRGAKYSSGFPFNFVLTDTASMAQDVGGGLVFGGNDGTVSSRWWGGIRGGKENATSGNYAGYLALSTRQDGVSSNTEWMRITSSGYVGLGTTSPIAGLHQVTSGDLANRNALFDYYGTDASGVRVVLRKARGTSVSPSAVQAGDGLGFFGFRGYTSAGSFPSGSTAYIQAVAAENFTGSAQGSYLQFATTPTGSATSAVAMTILGSGNVGIGTTSPGGLLHLVGGNATDYKGMIIDTDGEASDIPFRIRTNTLGGGSATDADTKFLVQGDGNVGIGTTSPGAKLEVNGDIYLSSGSSREIKVADRTTTGNGFDLTIKAGQASGAATYGGNLKLFAGGSDDIPFQGGDVFIAGVGAAGSDVILAHNGTSAIGRVGIGTTNPLALLSVGATSQFQVSSAGDITAPTSTNTINSLVINSGALSGITTLSMNNQLTSTLAIGTAPFNVTSTTLNTNLNADLLDNQHGAYYAAAASISGTQNLIAKFATTTTVGDSRIFDNGTNIGIGNTNPLTYLNIGNAIYMTALGGNVGIGTTLPGNKLSVSGGVGIGTTAPSSLYLSSKAPDGGLIVEGNVGIGTTGPGAKLHIVGAGGVIGYIESTNLSDVPLLEVKSSNRGVDLGVFGQTSGGIFQDQAILLSNGSTGALNLRVDNASGYFRIFTGGDTADKERLRITSDGNVGIGTTAPGNKLTVSGGVGIGTTAPGSLYLSTKAPDGGLIVEGNVGIGTTSPGAKLEVNGDIYLSRGGNRAIGIPTSPTNTQGYSLSVYAGNGGPTGGPPIGGLGGNLNLYAGNTTTVSPNPGGSVYIYGGSGATYGNVILASNGTSAIGNVGIGTTTPGNKLSVSGGVGIGTTAPGSLYLSTQAPDGGLIVEGNVGIGTTAPGHLLDLGGGTYADSGGAWHDASDIRYKKDITDLPYGLAEIMRLETISYVNTTGYNKRQLGFSAQQVQPIIPELVEETNGRLSFAYGRVAPVIVKAIQEQQGEISGQGTAINEQQNRITNYGLQITNQSGNLNDLQSAVNEKLNVISNSLASIDSKLAAGEVTFSSLKSKLADASAKLKEQENSLFTFETSTNDLLSSMMDTEKMLTEKVLDHEDRIKALEDKIATLSVSNGGELPANLVTQDTQGNAALAGIFKAKDIQAETGSFKGSLVTDKISAKGVSSEGVVAGAYAVKTDAESGKNDTIGSGKILEVKKDEDKDGIDDETGSDGKSVVIKNTAVKKDSKLFVTSRTILDQPLVVTKIKDGENFTVEKKSPTNQDIEFDWWIIGNE